jgi:hypothetical protein
MVVAAAGAAAAGIVALAGKLGAGDKKHASEKTGPGIGKSEPEATATTTKVSQL